jgi:hypothetical protein
MVSTLLGLSSTNGRDKPPFRVEDDAVQPTRGVGAHRGASGYITTGRVVASHNAGGWFSTEAPP